MDYAENLYNEISIWQDETFPKSNVMSKLAHLKLEVDELEESIGEGDRIAAAKELADCFILLAGVARKMNMSYYDVVKAVRYKHEVNKTRTWGTPDEKGIVLHTNKN